MISFPTFTRRSARRGRGRMPTPLILGAILLLIAAAGSEAAAQGTDPRSSWVERDAQGRRTGTVDPSSSSGYVLRDAQGRRTGTLEPGAGGTWVERDAQGRRTGTKEPR